jgi:CheY-like chemotaxis protein
VIDNASIKLLVVDDDPFFLRVLEKRFGAEGYQVATATDGREGMKVIVSFEPDLVISDWMMPEVDGLELCQSVKTGLREAAPYFILLTAKGEISDRLLGLETGADDYLVKPCDQGELMARIRAGIRIVRLTQDLRRAVIELQRAAGCAPGPRGDAIPEDPGIRAACPQCHRVLGDDGEWRSIAEHATWHAQGSEESPVCPSCARGRARKAA